MGGAGVSVGARIRELVAVSLVAGSALAWGQNPVSDATGQPADLAQSVQELQAQIKELREAVAELRSEAAQYHAETIALRQELQTTHAQVSTTVPVPPAETPATPAATNASAYGVPGPADTRQSAEPNPGSLEERLQLLESKIDEQHQSKVESASRYRVRLSGIVLFNLFDTHGAADNSDFPHLVLDRAPGQTLSTFGGTLRQSMLGLEVFGPQVAGAKTTADIQFDFAGGFAQTSNGVTSGLVRLRTATLRLDWARTSVVAGQDGLFFAPLVPTSLASLAVPALSYSGSLWSWTPQLRVEHQFKFSDNSGITVQGGILDPLTGESPASPYYRKPQAGEASGAPAAATRVAWSTKVFGQPLAIGAAGYYSRQDWGFGRTVDGWAGMSDWTLPLGSRVSFTGELYRGRAIGGLGGGIGRSAVWDGPLSDPYSFVAGLDAAGGWSQLKVRANSKLEFNVAAGQDSSFSSEVRIFPDATGYFGTVSRNRSGFVNFIYRPRSDVLFSMEYRRLQTGTVYGDNNTANHVDLSMGILF